MDILFFILAVYGLYVIGSLLVAAFSDALPRSEKKDKEFYGWLQKRIDERYQRNT